MSYFREAWRGLKGAPLVSLLALLSLALGVGANATFFSIFNTLVFKPLPVREPARLVVVDDGSWTNAVWEYIRDQQTELFDGAFAWSTASFDLADGGPTDLVDGAYVSGDMFRVLSVLRHGCRTPSRRHGAPRHGSAHPRS
jgi:putative ABC transport system permease protein